MQQHVTSGDLAATEARLTQLINRHYNQLKELLMATQADIDALTTEITNAVNTITTDLQTLGSDVTNVQAEITALQQQNPTVDVTALQAAANQLDSTVTSLGTSVDSVTALVPPAPPTGG